MEKFEFEGSQGHLLSARLDLPEGEPLAYALFAHCFTCGKDLTPASRIVQSLTEEGIAVMRFDFTGLGKSGGAFEDTNFTSNVKDLYKAVEYMREHLEAPSLMIGHSLGGTAVLVAAHDVEEVNAVVTIGAPSNTTNVMKQFGCDVDTIETEGQAEVELAGRPFTIKKQFLDDIKSQDIENAVHNLKKPLLVCHSPIDDTVPIAHAGDIYRWAMHPKSFISLNTHDHLLFAEGAAEYVARCVSAWAWAYLPNLHT